MFGYEVIKSLNEMEVMIYNYIISNASKVITMTIRELASELHVSSTTILRFCNKVGCEGYSEFKYKFKEYVNSTHKSDTTDDVSLLQDFFRKIEVEDFQKELQEAAALICSRPKLFFIGLGTSGTLGKFAARYFSNLRINALYIDDPFYPTEGGDYEDAVIVALSVSGEQRTLHKQINGFKNGKAIIISITNTHQCTLANISDFNLAYYMPMKVLPGLYNVTSQVPVMYLIEALAHRTQQLKEK